MMDSIDVARAQQSQEETARLGPDGSLDIYVVPTETLNSPSYNSLTVHQGNNRLLALSLPPARMPDGTILPP